MAIPFVKLRLDEIGRPFPSRRPAWSSSPLDQFTVTQIKVVKPGRVGVARQVRKTLANLPSKATVQVQSNVAVQNMPIPAALTGQSANFPQNPTKRQSHMLTSMSS